MGPDQLCYLAVSALLGLFSFTDLFHKYFSSPTLGGCELKMERKIISSQGADGGLVERVLQTETTDVRSRV